MMRGIPIVDTEQMRALDRAAIEEDSIPSLVLMERAGYGCSSASPSGSRRLWASVWRC